MNCIAFFLVFSSYLLLLHFYWFLAMCFVSKECGPVDDLSHQWMICMFPLYYLALALSNFDDENVLFMWTICKKKVKNNLWLMFHLKGTSSLSKQYPFMCESLFHDQANNTVTNSLMCMRWYSSYISTFFNHSCFKTWGNWHVSFSQISNV